MGKLSQLDSDRQIIERLRDVVQPPSFERTARADAPDILDKLAVDIKASVKETCAKVAEIHRVSRPENQFHHGYNQAVADIAAKIREL